MLKGKREREGGDGEKGRSIRACINKRIYELKMGSNRHTNTCKTGMTRKPEQDMTLFDTSSIRLTIRNGGGPLERFRPPTSPWLAGGDR